MWILKLTLTTFWMAGMLAGWTLGGLSHLAGLLALALVFIEETPVERRLLRFRFAAPRPGPRGSGHAVAARP